MSAQADRVVLLRVTGAGDLEQQHDLEEAIAEAIAAVGHAPVTESGTVDPDAPAPSTPNELQAVAELHRATYVVVPSASFDQDSYRVRLVVGYAPESRREEIDALVWHQNQSSRLTAILAAALRPAGFGDDKAALETDPPAPGDEPEPDSPPIETEPPPVAEQPIEPLATPQLPPPVLSPWTLSAGIDARPLLYFPQERDGGTLLAFSLRLGHHLDAVPGLELRAVAEGHTGAAGGLLIGAGGAYWFLHFESIDLRFGAAAELGYHQALTGDQTASFMARVAPLIAWDANPHFFLEASGLEVQWLTANDVVSLGFGLRAGLRL